MDDSEDVRMFTDKSSKGISKGTASIQQISDKAMKIIPTFSFSEVITSLTNINSKYENFPSLFVFIIQTNNLKSSDKPNLKDISTCLNNFTKSRPLILKISSKNAVSSEFYLKEIRVNNFISIDVNQNDPDNFEILLNIFMDQTKDCFDDETIWRILRSKNSTMFLKFLQNWDFYEDPFQKLILKCASNGTLDQFLAVLGGSYKFLNENAQFWISTTFNETSILNEAIKNEKENVVNYLISRCTHLIQQLPFDDRAIISSNLNNAKKYKTLCNLLEISDFPFPKDFETSNITDKRLKDIMDERRNFHDAISTKNFDEVKKFVNKNYCLKLVYNHQNETSIFTAFNSKNYDVLTYLQSLGFSAEEKENCDYFSTEIKQLREAMNSQTQKNANAARPDEKRTVYYLMARSFIHNRMLNKQKESAHRAKIKKWYEIIYDIPLCCKFLDVASQCKDLKIIFDFESENVSLSIFYSI